MTRTVSATITSAVAQDATQPIYLIYMAWDAASPDHSRIATWNSAIEWGGYTWAASGASCRGIDVNGGTLLLPMGENDPWLTLVRTDVARGRAVEVWEHQTDLTASPQQDATQIFGGIMDSADISQRGISIALIPALKNKRFPHTVIDEDTYTHLLSSGQRIYWGPDIVKVE